MAARCPCCWDRFAKIARSHLRLHTSGFINWVFGYDAMLKPNFRVSLEYKYKQKNIKKTRRGIMEKGLKDLLIDELHDILSSEEQILKALPAMVKAAESPDLKNAFEIHLKETKGQVQRLDKVFKLLKAEKKEKFCKATKGLIEECKDVLKDFKTKSPIRDAALISKAQRIEHYEIAAYGTVRTFASELNLDKVADLLQETLDEEANADKKLTKLAEGGLFRSGINLQANTASENKPKVKPKVISKKAKTSSPKHKPLLAGKS